MSFIFTNHKTGENIKSDDSQNYDELLALLRKMTTPKNTLITTLPSGIGLDFEVQEDGELWIEFYGGEPSGAFVTMAEAEEVVKRAFQGINKNIKNSYADLISEWE